MVGEADEYVERCSDEPYGKCTVGRVGDGESKRYSERASEGDSVLIGLRREDTDERVEGPMPSAPPGACGDARRRLACRGAHFAARECHFSLGSPLRKLLSAHRGCGLPRSSRTKLSNSAILLRRRVVSSTLGSSLSAGSSTSYTQSPVRPSWMQRWHGRLRSHFLFDVWQFRQL